MEETQTVPQLDPSDFTLSAYDNISIAMPPIPLASEEDIDAQLFEYVASAEKGSGIKSIADLDDSWVNNMFQGLNTIAELRNAIRSDFERQGKSMWENLKFQRCAEALIGRLEGVVDETVVQANVEASRAQYDERLRSFGMTKAQYLREEHLTEDEFEKKFQHDVAHQIRVNMALDKMIEVNNTEVAKSELIEYLSCEDPAAFVAELEEKGLVEDARHAAARVKIMRRIVETAIVEDEEETEVPSA